jgi:peptidoglycan pentaglycine glycine transferase (the first glycine)
MPEIDSHEWNDLIKNCPNAHLLQTPAWGEFKKSYGWEVAWVSSEAQSKSSAQAGAQLLFKRLLPGLSFAYLPKGPLFPPGASAPSWLDLIPEIDTACRKRRAVFLKIEPDLWESESPPTPPDGFENATHAIQPPRTLIVDLRGSEDQILGQMKQKTRYNIKLSQKKGVVVHPSADIETFHRLLEVTGGRDEFGVHSLDYYHRVYELFHSRGECELLMASFQGEPLAGLMVFAHGNRAWYLYGASTSSHRDRMPNYILQWEAMRWARDLGCIEYDLWGVPDVDEETLEEQFNQHSEGLWGVYRFKRGFGGKICRAAGPWDRVYNPLLYSLYRIWMKRQRGRFL